MSHTHAENVHRPGCSLEGVPLRFASCSCPRSVYSNLPDPAPTNPPEFRPRRRSKRGQRRRT